LLVYALILPGIYLTARGRDVAGYHLFVAVGGLALIGFVHFVPVGGHEAPIRDIYAAYGSTPAGLLALAVLAGLIISVAALALVALGTVRARSRAAKGG
jgi:tetrahydromethanopterin S-methyltransferase subunit D